VAFVAEAALIALREGLEALLITGILLGLVVKLGRPDARKHVWLGFGAAVVASLALGWVVQRYLLEAFEERGGAEWFELGAVAVAVVVLTYMVFWMWKHTRELMGTVRQRVEDALTRGALLTIVVLTFASVIREGLEVVLFYGALASRATPFDLAWSGLVGFAASAVLVFLILKGAKRFDLQGFFAATGVLLVFVAAGLLVHGVSALMGLGVLPPAPALWDTSGFLPDDSAGGRVLHALVGYTATPTLLQGLIYFGYVLGVGGWYLWSLGVFHRRTAEGQRVRRSRAVAAGLVVLLALAVVSAGAANPGALVTGHDHDDVETASMEGERFGVLLRSHGEPVHYNETTYRSFADFVKGLLIVLKMDHLLLVDQGTVLLDKARPFDACDPLRLDRQLMDAWMRDSSAPAVCVAQPPTDDAVAMLGGYYLAPGPGPGLGEPDVLEMAGLASYVSWLQMENESPMHESKGRVLDAAEAALKARYGDRVVVARSYHILPRVGPGESDAEAAKLFAAAGVTTVVDAYTSSIFSDVMNTCMMRPHLEHAFAEEAPGARLVHAGFSGAQERYARAVAAEVQRLLAEAPPGEKVAVFLTHHGQSPTSKNPCGQGPDQYHANAKRMHEAALAAIRETVQREGVTYYQVYGAGAGKPDDGVLSPLEALEEARTAGAARVIDLPYELTGDGFDNLVAQRLSWGLDPKDAPHYDARFQTSFTLGGTHVLIASAQFGAQARGEALADAIAEALSEGADAPHEH
jgi:high-affinity iron transporter